MATSAFGVVRRELVDFWSRNFAGLDECNATTQSDGGVKADDSGTTTLAEPVAVRVAVTGQHPQLQSKQPSQTTATKQQRRSSSYSSLLLLPLVYWNGHGRASLTTSLKGMRLSDASTASDSERRGHHSQAPSLDFEDNNLFDKVNGRPHSLGLDQLQGGNDEDDSADGSSLLAKYLLFDVLGDQDPRVVSMFSTAVATLEAHHRRMTSPLPSSDQALSLSESSAVRQLGDCTGGVYVLGDSSVFKPRAQEAMQKASYVTGDPSPLRKGFLIGDGAIREVAAYQLDRAANHFAGVPPTTLISVRSDVLGTTAQGPRLEGSLQRFSSNLGSSEDFGSSTFRLRDIQAVALLDIRLFNTDRHGGNLLVSNVVPDDDDASRKQYAVVPIDHGLCLPDFHHLGEFEAEWLYWRQAREPLSAAARAHVQSLDADRDAVILRRLGLREKSILTMQLMTRFLQYAVLTLNWNLHQIGVFLTRSHLSVGGVDADASGSGPSSEFEHLLRRAATNSADVSLPAFLRGDGSVGFTAWRAQELLVAAERQWETELLPSSALP